MTIQKRIQAAATIENAEQYAKSRDQFSFCMQVLGLTAYGYKTEHAVVDLRNEFDSLNAFGMTTDECYAEGEADRAVEKQVEQFFEEGIRS